MNVRAEVERRMIYYVHFSPVNTENIIIILLRDCHNVILYCVFILLYSIIL